MKTKFFLFGIVLSSFLISCKGDKETKVEGEVENAPKKETFKVSLNLIVKEDDSLQLFYKDPSMTEYDGSKTVWAPVKGSENPQDIVFDLPEDILPSQLRLDFGNNRKQQPIEVKQFTIKYMDKMFQAKDTMFFQYFIPNEQMEWDRKKAIAKFIVKEGVFYDPIFLSREIMDQELKKMIQ